MRKGKDPDPNLGGPKTCGSGSPTLVYRDEILFSCTRLLDLLSTEPRWGEGDFCEECQAKVRPTDGTIKY
jgi:hypothetical protein